MSRYIDVKWLKQNFNTAFWSQITKTIDSAPSIDIVRCGECKYWVSDGGALMKCDIHKDPTVPDHYCSYGEEDKDE